MMRHLFEEDHVDVAILQPTNLKEWYEEGFNTTGRDAILAGNHRRASSLRLMPGARFALYLNLA